MTKCVPGARCPRCLLDELGFDKIGQTTFGDELSNQTGAELSADDRRRVERLLCFRIEAIDAGTDRGLQGCGHLYIGDGRPALVGASDPFDDSSFREVTDDLLGEKWHARSAFADQTGQ